MDLSSVDIKMYSATLKALPQDFFPWFDVCHVILCVLSVRKEASRDFAWRHPFSAWLSCIIASFAGSFICGPLLGKYGENVCERKYDFIFSILFRKTHVSSFQR